MPIPLPISFHDFLLGISNALDLASEELSSHQVRTAFIAQRIAEELRMVDREALLLAALVHDIGFLSPEERIDLLQLHGEGDMDKHCIFGERLLSKISPLSASAHIVRGHHTRWVDSDRGSADFLANILYLADCVEVSMDRHTFVLLQRDEVRHVVQSGKGVDFAPELVEAFLAASAPDSFWLDLVSSAVGNYFRAEWSGHSTMVGQEDLQDLSELIRSIIDFRSPFTAAHSASVSVAAALMAARHGLSDREVSALRIAGNLHDVGKLSIPNAILNKPFGLSPPESAIMRRHPYHSYRIIQACGLSPLVAQSAGYHHEKLDGSGYPFGLSSEMLHMGARILGVADIFVALTEDRPYRPRMSGAVAEKELQELSIKGKVDPGLVDLLHGMRDELCEATEREAVVVKQVYEVDVTQGDAFISA